MKNKVFKIGDVLYIKPTYRKSDYKAKSITKIGNKYLYLDDYYKVSLDSEKENTLSVVGGNYSCVIDLDLYKKQMLLQTKLDALRGILSSFIYKSPKNITIEDLEQIEKILEKENQ